MDGAASAAAVAVLIDRTLSRGKRAAAAAGELRAAGGSGRSGRSRAGRTGSVICGGRSWARLGAGGGAVRSGTCDPARGRPATGSRAGRSIAARAGRRPRT